MTDQIPAGLTLEEAQTVREWAERARGAEVQDETVDHAARVLLAVLPTPPTTAKENPELPDQTLDDQVRPIVAAMRVAMRRDENTYSYAEFLDDMSDYIKALEALLPARPTLADIPEDERAACQWMQADIIGGDEPLVITRIDRTDGTALILDRNGCLDGVPAEHVTPRPDLPRLEWPGNTLAPAVPALPEGWRLADHHHYGRVLVTWETPDRDGDYYVQVADGVGATHPLGRFVPADELAFLDTDQEADQ